MKRLCLLVAVAVVFVLNVQPAPAQPAGTEHLPDLQTLKPSELKIDWVNGRKVVRFSNMVANLGDGRMELRPEHSVTGGLWGSLFPSSATTRAYQGIYSHNASGGWYKVREVFVGTFKFHTSHNHWHFEKFAKYELYQVNPDGSRGASLNRVSEKTTFCIIDTDLVNPNLTHSGPQTYRSCGQTSTTGLTVGWADKYGYNLDGQWIDVQGLADGTYWLVSTVDYANKLVESNDNNNEAAVKVKIAGNTVSAVG